MGDAPVAQRAPRLTPRVSATSLLPEWFARIDANDRDFVQQLPALVKTQSDRHRLLGHRDPATGHTPLVAALKRGYLDLAVDLLMLGARLSAEDLHGNVSAAMVHDDAVAGMLLQFMLSDGKHASSSERLADKGLQKLFGKIDRQTGHTLLTWAISQHHDAFVERLLDSGADFRESNQFRRTALQEACRSGSLPVVCRLLHQWSESGAALWQQHVNAAIQSAVDANRPMVLAQLLSFFRDEFRCRQMNMSGNEDEHPLNPVETNALRQRDALAFFLGVQRPSSATMDVMIDRTSDNFLLTEQESLLLELNKVVASAEKANQTKIVEIIRAHAKLPPGC